MLVLPTAVEAKLNAGGCERWINCMDGGTAPVVADVGDINVPVCTHSYAPGRTQASTQRHDLGVAVRRQNLEYGSEIAIGDEDILGRVYRDAKRRFKCEAAGELIHGGVAAGSQNLVDGHIIGIAHEDVAAPSTARPLGRPKVKLLARRLTVVYPPAARTSYTAPLLIADEEVSIAVQGDIGGLAKG